MANDCTIHALTYLLNDKYERLVADFKFDGKNPPDIHQIIDYLLEDGCALTPIMRRPVSIHKGAEASRFSPEKRFKHYLNCSSGLLMGTIDGIGHMTYLEGGFVYDGPKVKEPLPYLWTEAEGRGFDLHTLMVASWLT